MDTKVLNFKTVDQKDQPVSLFQDNVTQAFNQQKVINQTIPTSGNRKVYTSSGTWTKPKNLIYIDVELVGAGGGGGGTQATGVGESACGAHGGGGGYAKKQILAARLGVTEIVTIGAGGTAGTGAGGDGGASSFGLHLSATGGGGGAQGVNSAGSASAIGGGGGIGMNADINASGSAGGIGRVIGGALAHIATSGSSMWGGGDRYTNTGNGVTPDGYGAGGTGATATASLAARSGGEGALGLVIVTEFLQGE